MNPSAEVIFALCNRLPLELELALKLLAWAKLSRKKVLPEELRLTEKTKFDADHLQSTFKEISEIESLGENRLIFQNLVIQNSLDPILPQVKDIIYKFSQSSHLDSFEILESCYAPLGSTGLIIVPSELSQLMIKLAGDLKKKWVYCPYDTACFFAQRADQAGADAVYVESQLDSPIPQINNILCNTKIHVKFGDPVRHPSYTTPEGKLEKFNITLSFPPMGVKYDKQVYTQDWFSRFSINTGSGSVLQLEHILTQTEDKAVIAVPNNFSFGKGAEHSLRQEFLKRGLIEAIIAMPPAILPFTAIQVSILILNPKGGVDKIRFVNAGKEQFYERDGKGRSRLVKWEELLGVFHESKDEALALDVPVEKILENDAYLEVSRYLVPPKQKGVNTLLKSKEVTHLEDLVSLIRPSTKIQGEGELTACEVCAADFPEFGYIAKPERTITLASKSFQPKERDTFLKSKDIIIVTKGSVGKVAIVPDNVPPAGNGGWLVNQSCTILRLPRNSKIDPKVLFMYLRSELGQILLERIFTGATVPLIQLQSLKKLKIVIPSEEEVKPIVETFDHQVKLQQQIKELRDQQEKLAKAHWNIPD